MDPRKIDRSTYSHPRPQRIPLPLSCPCRSHSYESDVYLSRFRQTVSQHFDVLRKEEEEACARARVSAWRDAVVGTKVGS